MQQRALTKDRQGFGCGAAVLLAGLRCAADAWRVIAHHDGFPLPGLALTAAVIRSALLARYPRCGAGA